jgi:hypothetical protein
MKLNIVWFLGLLAASPLNAQASAATDSLRNAITAAAASGDQRAEAEALRWLAEAQSVEGNAVEALQHARRALQIFESLGDSKKVFETYSPLLNIHQQLHNGTKIIEIARAGLTYAQQTADTSLLIDMNTALGIGYDECKQHEEALRCYLQSIALEEKIGRSSTVGYANASSTFSWLHRYEEALQYARRAYQIAQSDGDTASMIFARLNEGLALSYLERGDELLAVIGDIETLAASQGMYDMEVNVTYLRAKAYALKGDYKQAYQYHQAFYQMDSAYSSSERHAQFAQLEALYQVKEKEVENARLSTDLARQRTGLVVTFGLLLLLGTFACFQQIRLKNKKKLLATEKVLAETERLRSAELQQHYERELEDFTRILIEKNQALEALQTNIAPSDTSSFQAPDLNSELRQLTILTDADWRNFRQKFERIHTGFFEKFQREVPEATVAEVRLAALTKLELSNPEIAAMLGISPESVIKTRYRLRKKLGERELEAVVG